MYFFDLLKTTDMEKAVLFLREQITDDGIPDFETQLRLYSLFREKLMKFVPKYDNNKILIGFPVSDIAFICEDDDEPVRPVTVNVFNVDGLVKNTDYIRSVTKEKKESDCNIDEINKLLKKYPNNDEVRGCCFEFSDWEEILGWLVDRKNIEEVGEDAFVAYILNEMTFNGFMEESQQERKDELQVSLDEYEKWKEAGPEKLQEHFVPIEKIFNEFGFKDERTEEEKKADRDKLKREMYRFLKIETETIADVLNRI